MTKPALLAALSLALLLATAGVPASAEQPPAADFQTLTVTTSDGVRLHVEIAGDGPPCLFLHGGPGAASDWMRKLSNGLFEKRFRMVYLDQRGAGASTSPANGDYSMDRMVADFEEVRAALGVERWFTMGHSFGGILQMGYFERHPRVVTGMLMLNCTLDMDDSFESSWVPKAVELAEVPDPSYCYDRSLPRMDRVMPLIRAMREKHVFWKFAYLRPESEDVMDATNDGVPERNHDLQYGAADLPDYSRDFRPAAANVTVPVLFFYGRQDWMVGPGHFKSVRFPTMLLFASDTGHFAVIDNRPDLARAIAGYMAAFFPSQSPEPALAP